MLHNQTRALLRQLNRRKFSGSTATRAAPHPVVPWSSSATPTAARPLLSTGTEWLTPCGTHWMVHQPLKSLWPAFDCHRKVPTDTRMVASLAAADAHQALLNHFPEQTLFLDLETCGFAGSHIFLAGVLHHQSGEVYLSQLWARNYAEERPLLFTLQTLLLQQKVLVTFNGKSFDWPQVRDRCVLYAGAADCGLPELFHLDLLHLSRRRWKNQVPDCRLQTLEREVCGRHRTGDIPGREIPGVYQHYVRTGDASLVGSILHHNALDLITLWQLALRVWSPDG